MSANGLERDQVVAVIGAGTMGAGIAQVAAQAGHRVLIHDARDGAAERGLETIDAMLATRVARGKLSAAERSDTLARIEPVDTLGQLEPAALVIEAIVEDLDTKRKLLLHLEDLVHATSVLATNTSSLSVTELAAPLADPGRVVGMHFFNPAPIMRLVEIVTGLATSTKVAQGVAATARAWGKTPVLARSTPGFIVNRVARPYYAEALRVVQEGAADPATVDAVMRETGGFRMGPFELMDLIGNDVNFEVTRSMFETCFNDPRYLPSLMQRELVAAGRLGRKSGHGFYSYAEGSERPAPHTAAVAPAPDSVRVGPSPGPVAALADALLTTNDVGRDADLRCVARIDELRIALTDGRTATERASDEGIRDLVLFDLALDYAHAPRIALCRADQTSDAALAAAVGLFQAIGKTVSVIDDVPGMIVMRTVCMLVNEAADALHHGVCSARDLDAAMRLGVNYPRGPLAWAESVGLDRVLETTQHLARAYGEDRYRPSPLLRRKVFGKRRFHDIGD